MANAKWDTHHNLPVENTYPPIERRFIGMVIGYKGDTIKNLRRQHKVDIEIEDDKEVIISGMKDDIEDAWHSISVPS